MFLGGKHLYRLMMQNVRISLVSLWGALWTMATSTLCAEVTAPLDNARNLIQEWVLTEQLISEERTEWAEEEATLHNLITLMKDEVSLLTKQIKKAEAQASESDKKKAALLEDEKAMEAIRATLITDVASYEQALKGLQAKLPRPLQNKLDAFIRKFPEEGGVITVSLAQRLQTLVSMLAEIETFNQAVTLDSHIRQMPDGQKIQITALYFGLAGAYFLDKSGQRAGVLAPGSEGWSVTEKPELAAPIAQAIEIHQGIQPAAFINLPLSVE